MNWYPKSEVSRACELQLSTEATSISSIGLDQVQVWRKCVDVLGLITESESTRPVSIAVSAWIDVGDICTLVQTTREGGTLSPLASITVYSKWLRDLYSSFEEFGEKDTFDRECEKTIVALYDTIKNSLSSGDGLVLQSQLKGLKHSVYFYDGNDSAITKPLLNE